MPNFCSGCGQPAEQGGAFCPHCGRRYGDSPPACLSGATSPYGDVATGTPVVEGTPVTAGAIVVEVPQQPFAEYTPVRTPPVGMIPTANGHRRVREAQGYCILISLMVCMVAMPLAVIIPIAVVIAPMAGWYILAGPIVMEAAMVSVALCCIYPSLKECGWHQTQDFNDSDKVLTVTLDPVCCLIGSLQQYQIPYTDIRDVQGTDEIVTQSTKHRTWTYHLHRVWLQCSRPMNNPHTRDAAPSPNHFLIDSGRDDPRLRGQWLHFISQRPGISLPAGSPAHYAV